MNNHRDSTDRPAVPAGFWQRTIAALTDFVLSFVLVFALLSATDEAGDDPARWVEVLAAVLFFAAVCAYFVAGNLLGRTPGLLVTGSRVVDYASGHHPHLWQAVGRAAVTIMTFFSFAWVTTADADQTRLNLMFGGLLALSLIGHLWMLRDGNRRTVFDRILGLAVVRRATAHDNLPVAPPTGIR